MWNYDTLCSYLQWSSQVWPSSPKIDYSCNKYTLDQALPGWFEVYLVSVAYEESVSIYDCL